MSKRILNIGLIFLAVIIIAGGLLIYSFLRTPEVASAPIEALPVSEEVDSSSVIQTGLTDGAVFQIIPSESEVRFIIDEVLRGSPKTVVGKTDQVAGEILVAGSDPNTAEVGTIRVNARTLVTDNDFRNRAIKNRILDTNNYEFISFTPKEIVGLPDTAISGETYEFLITGDLIIKDVTREVAFETSLTIESERRLTGRSSATVAYADFGIVIPEAPSVTSVADEVILEIDFVALAQ